MSYYNCPSLGTWDTLSGMQISFLRVRLVQGRADAAVVESTVTEENSVPGFQPHRDPITTGSLVPSQLAPLSETEARMRQWIEGEGRAKGRGWSQDRHAGMTRKGTAGPEPSGRGGGG